MGKCRKLPLTAAVKLLANGRALVRPSRYKGVNYGANARFKSGIANHRQNVSAGRRSGRNHHRLCGVRLSAMYRNRIYCMGLQIAVE